MRKRIRVRAFAAAVAAVATIVASPGFAAEKEEKIENIRKLVHIMSGEQMKDMMDKVMQSVLQSIESQLPEDGQADPEMRQALGEYLKTISLGEKDLEEMLDLMIPYYDKYLDEGDVRALLGFYESPAGKKFIRVMPEMMAEMMPRIMGWQMDRLKAPMETFRKRLDAIEEKRRKEKAGAGPGA